MPIINWLSFIAGCALTALLAYSLHSIVSDWNESRHKSELTAQSKMLQDKCDSDKAITEKINNEDRKKIIDLNSSLGNYKRLLNDTRNKMPITNPPNNSNGENSGGLTSGQSSSINESFLDIAASGEDYRIKLKSCQDFIKKVWEANGQEIE